MEIFSYTYNINVVRLKTLCKDKHIVHILLKNLNNKLKTLNVCTYLLYDYNLSISRPAPEHHPGNSGVEDYKYSMHYEFHGEYAPGFPVQDIGREKSPVHQQGRPVNHTHKDKEENDAAPFVRYGIELAAQQGGQSEHHQIACKMPEGGGPV